MVEISVIVPVYKVERYLCDCIDSILQQTFREFELILIDDGSPDHCGQICDEYAKVDDRVRAIHQKNGGLSAARNAGLDLADGEFITFVDSDDILDGQYLQRLYETLAEYQADVAVCNSCRIINKDELSSHDVDQGDACFLMGNREAVKTLCKYGKDQLPVTAWGKLYKKELFINLRYPVGIINEDEYLTPRLLYRAERIVWIKEALYGYRKREESIMGEKFSIRRYDGIWAIESCIDYFNAIPDRDIVELMMNKRDELIAFFALLAREAGIYKQVPAKYRMSRLKAITTMKKILPYDVFEHRLHRLYPRYILVEAHIRRFRRCFDFCAK